MSRTCETAAELAHGNVETAFSRAVKEPFLDLCAIRAKDVTGR